MGMMLFSVIATLIVFVVKKVLRSVGGTVCKNLHSISKVPLCATFSGRVKGGQDDFVPLLFFMF